MRITTPVAGFTGTVAGVVFTDGASDGPVPPGALAYFTRHGYGVQHDPSEVDDPSEDAPVKRPRSRATKA